MKTENGESILEFISDELDVLNSWLNSAISITEKLEQEVIDLESYKPHVKWDKIKLGLLTGALEIATGKLLADLVIEKLQKVKNNLKII
jgi:hypothetical protein